MNPEVSILMCTYNGDAFLEETIQSILDQCFDDWELIVYDDGSSDMSVDIVRSYSDKRIKIFLLPNNRINNLNNGINLAKGRYIARIDHDDVMLPERLLKQYDFMEYYPDIVVCGSWIEGFGHNYRNIVKCIEKHEDIALGMIIGNQMANPATFIRKEFLIHHSIHYKEWYSFAEDYKFWFDILKAGGRFHNLQEVLLRYRYTENQTSVKKAQEIARASFDIQKEIFAYYLFKTGYYDNVQLKAYFEPVMKLFKSSNISSDIFFEQAWLFISNCYKRFIY